MRVNFNYFLSEGVFRYLVEAVALVAEHGHKLTPLYRFDAASGLWRHEKGAIEPPLRLSQLSYVDGELTYPHHEDAVGEEALAGYLAFARELLSSLPELSPENAAHTLGADFEHLRWFDLPKESLA